MKKKQKDGTEKKKNRERKRGISAGKGKKEENPTANLIAIPRFDVALKREREKFEPF